MLGCAFRTPSVLDGSVHALDLTVGPRMPGLGKTMVDVVLGAGVFEGVRPDGLALLDRQFDIGGGGADVPRVVK